MDTSKMVESFIEKRTEEERALTLQFARAILELQLEKKGIDNDIKVIREEAKANGVLVGHVNKAIAQMKKLIKTQDSEIAEEERILEMLETDEDVKALLYNIIEK
jgi:uncharacterized protein (UPF0335 family)